MITEKDPLKQVLLNCRSILVSNDKLSPDGIYDELSKIRFLKNQYDHKCRKTKEGQNQKRDRQKFGATYPGMMAEAENPVSIFMVPVKTEFGSNIDHHQDTAGHSDSKTGDINK